MRLCAAAVSSLFFLVLSGCQPPQEGHTKVVIGAVLIDGAGGPPVTDSVVVIADGRILGAGARSTVPIPSEADKVNGSGRFLVPALVDIWPGNSQSSLLRPSSPEEAHEQVARLAGKVSAIHVEPLPEAVAQSVFSSARDSGVPVIGHVSTAAQAQAMVSGGASGLVGSPADKLLDPAFLATLRDLRIFVAPALASLGSPSEIARRNALLLFQAGVPIALASNGGDPLREAEALSDAGIPPLDVIVAGTRNSAIALRLTDRGTIQPGRRADLLLLSANPGEDIRNLRKVALRLSEPLPAH